MFGRSTGEIAFAALIAARVGSSILSIVSPILLTIPMTTLPTDSTSGLSASTAMPIPRMCCAHTRNGPALAVAATVMAGSSDSVSSSSLTICGSTSRAVGASDMNALPNPQVIDTRSLRVARPSLSHCCSSPVALLADTHDANAFAALVAP